MTEFFVLAQGAAAPAAQPVAAAPAAAQGKTTAPANGNAAPPQSAFGGLMGMLPMIIIIVAMFYLMWRGQAKERKKRETMLSAIKNGDRVVTIGGMTGEPIRFPTRFLIFNDLRLRGFWWDKWQRTHSREECDALFSEVFGLIADGTLKAPVDSRFKMEDIEAAMKRATENSRLGKVMLEF